MDRNIENILDTGGRNLSPPDRQFVNTLFNELEQFQYQAPKDRALMFHPLGGYQRYLIHKVTEIFPKLTSFSIGDDQNRRTVVCFKSKRKEQQLQQMGPNSPEKHPLRGRGNDYGTAPSRSRDSSKARNRQNEPLTERPLSKRVKDPEQVGHIPKPLRSKKAAKQANSMPRSRSVHASPARPTDREPYYTDDDRRRKAKDRENGTPSSRRKTMPRSASMKDTRKSRSRPTTPLDTERPRSGMVSRPSENSLKKRGQGLRLEGMVVNGDVEDPYNRDSDYEQTRSDAEAIKREKSRKRQDSKKRHKSRKVKSEPESSDQDLPRSRRPHAASPPPRHPSDSEESVERKPRKRSASSGSRRRDKAVERKQKEAPERHRSEKPLNTERHSDISDDYISDEPRRSGRSGRKPQKNGYVDDELNSPSEIDVRIHSDDEDELPPSYDKSSEMGSPSSKAKRNLNRIRRADSLRSRSSANNDRSPSNSSVRSDTTSRHEDEPKESKRKTTSTFPRHSKRRPDDEEMEPKAIATKPGTMTNPKDATPTSNIPKRRRSVGSVKSGKKSSRKPKSQLMSNSQPDIGAYEDRPRRVSANPDQPPKNRPNYREERADVHLSPMQPRRSDENLLASDATLYMPLPNKTVPPPENHFLEAAPIYPSADHDYVNTPGNLVEMPPQPVTHQAPPSSHSTLSSPVTDGSQGFVIRKDATVPKCDSEVQTEVTGTLPRKSGSKRSTPVQKAATQAAPPVAPSPPILEPTMQESPSYHTADSSTPSYSTTPSAAANEKLMEEFCKVMLNFQKMFITSQTATAPSDSSYSSPSHGPKMEPFHPFAPYYPPRSSHDSQPTVPVPPMALYNQFPPHIAHQLYLSWMAAYYAGATGSLPPPPPVPTQMSVPQDGKSNTPQYEYPSYTATHGVQPHSFPGYMDERAKGDYRDPTEPQGAPYNNPDYYQPSHPMYYKEPSHKMEQPGSFSNDEYKSFPDGVDSQGGRSSHSDWDRDSKKRGRPVHKWPSSEGNSKPSDPTRSTSTVLTDGADTDVSSVTSSSTHPEVAMKEGKGGVVVYVRSSSQSNSRANSTVSGGEDAISLHSASSHGLTLLPPTNSHINSRSRDGDDEDTPDPKSKAAHKKKGKAINGGADWNQGEGRKHSKKGPRERRSATPKGTEVNGGGGPPGGEGLKRTSPKVSAAAQHSSPSKKDAGYDADRSTNLGSEENFDNTGSPPVNGLPNGPNSTPPPDLEAHIDGDVTVQEPQFDYYNWTPNAELYSSEPYNSIVEIHDFPPEFKDKDIIKHFKKMNGFKLVWVDDTHALGMFSSVEDAEEALKMNPRMMRLRPLVHASTQSRKKAKMRVEEFGDYSSASSKPRPETSNVVAKKMVLGALGIKESQRDKEKQAELRNMRQSKKQRAKE